MERVHRRLLRETAYESIRDAVVRGDLAPGEAVNSAELADQLGLSRAPVRDALARLADEGLIETKPQSYTRVTPVTPSEARDAAAVVRAMHELAASITVGRLMAEDLDDMRRANHRFETAIRDGDIDAALAADDDLHGVLVKASGNRALAATIERYTPLIRRLERLQFAQSHARRSVERHDDLIAACAAGDTTEALRLTALIWRSLEENHVD
ncbi:GntR family transcriptional regulator [Actinoplanes solisilvae]|uniref:GntR family transcriptional regulator n=1 Tax=Actinoplanes solisilvae TaxID=2486853 RepID=UPI000FD999E2|nr:GntR family transcriptional regulator [Actinoplanes solisilvae]